MGGGDSGCGCGRHGYGNGLVGFVVSGLWWLVLFFSGVGCWWLVMGVWIWVLRG